MTSITPTGVKLTNLTKKQADYFGVRVNGPYRPERLPVLRFGRAALVRRPAMKEHGNLFAFSVILNVA